MACMHSFVNGLHALIGESQLCQESLVDRLLCSSRIRTNHFSLRTQSHVQAALHSSFLPWYLGELIDIVAPVPHKMLIAGRK